MFCYHFPTTSLCRSGKFEGICLPVFKSFMEPVRSFVESAGTVISDVQKVVLVGGTCKVPKLQQLLQETFPEGEVLWSVPPDHVASLGAAMQGGCINELTLPGTSLQTNMLCTPTGIVVKVYVYVYVCMCACVCVCVKCLYVCLL